jgi:hypothetical protein
MVHKNGNQSQLAFGRYPYQNAIENRIPIWMKRCKQLEKTAASGMITLGIATLLISDALSAIEVVPVLHATEKKLNGTMPHRRNTGKLGTLETKILVKTNVNTAIMTRGFSMDHNAPSDMLR